MTRITERQSINVVYVLLVLLWAFFGAGILLLSFWSKMTHAGFDAKQEIENCQRDYAQNK